MSSISMERLISDADAVNVRLEIVRGIPIWEASPSFGHQLEIDRIRSSIALHPKSNCIHVASVLFSFPDGSLTCPDIAVLQGLPDQQDAPLTIIPEAVIEIISEGYEYKDLEISPSFYLSVGVKDVLVLDPQLKVVYHHRHDGKKRLESPVMVELECGCMCEI
jgi:Uma2 family endonuclease